MTASSQNTKLYSKNALTIGGALFGPFAAIYFFYKNFKNLGQTKKAAGSILMGVLITLGLFLILSFLPRQAALPVTLGLLFGLYEWKMREPLDSHKKTGGKFYSPFRTILIGLVWLLVAIVLLFGLPYLVAKTYYPRLTIGEFLGIVATSDNPDTEIYAEKSAQIEAHDKEALEIFNLPASATSETYISAADKGIALYKQTLQIINEVEKLKRLAPIYKEEIGKIKRYTELRIQMFELLKKAEIEQTNQYRAQIDAIDKQIADLVYD
jgi:hypothetical protein